MESDAYDFDTNWEEQDTEEDSCDPSPACRYCEWSREAPPSALFVYCACFGCEVCATGTCARYGYDLLKRKPKAPRPLPFSVDLPPL